MQKMTDIDSRLTYLVKSHEATGKDVSPDDLIRRDLLITGSDFIDFIADVEKEFDVDLTSFLLGPRPIYMKTPFLRRLFGKKILPVFRDITTEEIHNYLKISKK